VNSSEHSERVVKMLGSYFNLSVEGQTLRAAGAGGKQGLGFLFHGHGATVALVSDYFSSGSNVRLTFLNHAFPGRLRNKR
jgi:hypothetical protein